MKDSIVWKQMKKVSQERGSSSGSKRARLSPPPPMPPPPYYVWPSTDGVDRLSDLPKSLLHKIMSLLSNHEAVQVSALSRHHYSVWRSHPRVELDYRAFTRRARISDAPVIPSPREFSAHIRDTLQRRALAGADLESFTLHCLEFPSNDDHIELTFVNLGAFIVENHVTELYLNLGDSNLYPIHNGLFSLTSVKKVFLSGFDLARQPGDLTLDAPKIEEFYLQNCKIGESLSLLSPGLKTAAVTHCHGLGNPVIRFPNREETEKTELESFKFLGRHRGKFQIENLSSRRKLKTLVLQGIIMRDEWFEDEVSKLPLVETFRFRNCVGPRNMEVRSKTLIAMEMDECRGIGTVKVVGQMVYSFVYNRATTIEPDIKICVRDCPNIRVLELKGASGTVTDRWAQTDLVMLEFLEKLVLANCNHLGDLSISLARLQGLELIKLRSLSRFEVWAPQLVSFVFEGRVSEFNAPTGIHCGEAEGEIKFNNFIRNEFKTLRDFLSYFSGFKSLSLTVHRDERIVYLRSDRTGLDPPLYNLRHLKLVVIVMYNEVLELVESALWLAPCLKSLRIYLNVKPYVTMKFNYKPPDERAYRRNLRCCKNAPVKCWRHSIYEVEVETFPNFQEGMESLSEFFERYAGFPVPIRRVMCIMID